MASLASLVKNVARVLITSGETDYAIVLKGEVPSPAVTMSFFEAQGYCPPGEASVGLRLLRVVIKTGSVALSLVTITKVISKIPGGHTPLPPQVVQVIMFAPGVELRKVFNTLKNPLDYCGHKRGEFYFVV